MPVRVGSMSQHGCMPQAWLLSTQPHLPSHPTHGSPLSPAPRRRPAHRAPQRAAAAAPGAWRWRAPALAGSRGGRGWAGASGGRGPAAHGLRIADTETSRPACATAGRWGSAPSSAAPGPAAACCAAGQGRRAQRGAHSAMLASCHHGARLDLAQASPPVSRIQGRQCGQHRRVLGVHLLAGPQQPAHQARGGGAQPDCTASEGAGRTRAVEQRCVGATSKALGRASPWRHCGPLPAHLP